MAPRLAPWIALAGVAHAALLGVIALHERDVERPTAPRPRPEAEAMVGVELEISPAGAEEPGRAEAADWRGALAPRVTSTPMAAAAQDPARHGVEPPTALASTSRSRAATPSTGAPSAMGEALPAGAAVPLASSGSAMPPGSPTPAGGAAFDGGDARASEGRHLSLGELGVGPGDNPFIGSVDTLPSERQRLNQRLRQSLRGELARRDQALGLGPEGPAIEAVKAIVFDSASAPNNSALLRIRTDEAGVVTLVEVLESERDADEWQRIAERLRAALAAKPLRVPPRSRGVALELRVKSRVQLPSGADPGLGVTVLGIPLKKGDGDKSAQISILSPGIHEVEIPGTGGATLPVPTLTLAGASGDLADIGAVARRLVTAYLVTMDADFADPGAPAGAPSPGAPPPAP